MNFDSKNNVFIPDEVDSELLGLDNPVSLHAGADLLGLIYRQRIKISGAVIGISSHQPAPLRDSLLADFKRRQAHLEAAQGVVEAALGSVIAGEIEQFLADTGD